MQCTHTCAWLLRIEGVPPRKRFPRQVSCSHANSDRNTPLGRILAKAHGRNTDHDGRSPDRDVSRRGFATACYAMLCRLNFASSSFGSSCRAFEKQVRVNALELPQAHAAVVPRLCVVGVQFARATEAVFGFGELFLAEHNHAEVEPGFVVVLFFADDAVERLDRTRIKKASDAVRWISASFKPSSDKLSRMIAFSRSFAGSTTSGGTCVSRMSRMRVGIGWKPWFSVIVAGITDVGLFVVAVIVFSISGGFWPLTTWPEGHSQPRLHGRGNEPRASARCAGPSRAQHRFGRAGAG